MALTPPAPPAPPPPVTPSQMTQLEKDAAKAEAKLQKAEKNAQKAEASLKKAEKAAEKKEGNLMAALQAKLAQKANKQPATKLPLPAAAAAAPAQKSMLGDIQAKNQQFLAARMRALRDKVKNSSSDSESDWPSSSGAVAVVSGGPLATQAAVVAVPRPPPPPAPRRASSRKQKMPPPQAPAIVAGPAALVAAPGVLATKVRPPPIAIPPAAPAPGPVPAALAVQKQAASPRFPPPRPPRGPPTSKARKKTTSRKSSPKRASKRAASKRASKRGASRKVAPAVQPPVALAVQAPPPPPSAPPLAAPAPPAPPAAPPSAARLQQDLMKGDAKLVGLNLTGATILYPKTGEVLVTPRAMLAKEPCSTSAVQSGFLKVVQEGYLNVYKQRVELRIKDLQELISFGLLHPSDTVWLNQLREYADSIKLAAPLPCAPSDAVQVQRSWAQMTYRVLHKYEEFRNRVFNSSQYHGRVNRYCMDVEEGSCGKDAAGPQATPCMRQGRKCVRKPRSQKAEEYRKKHSGFNLERDCVSFPPKDEFILLDRRGLESQLAATDGPGALAFLEAYRARYKNSLDVLASDLAKLHAAGVVHPDTFKDWNVRDLPKAYAELNQIPLDISSLGAVIKTQQMMSLLVYPIVHQFRSLRHMILNDSRYKNKLARFCESRLNQASCNSEVACEYTQGGIFSSPGCRLKPRSHSSINKKEPLKTLDDCN